jgi:hypothetical protein
LVIANHGIANHKKSYQNPNSLLDFNLSRSSWLAPAIAGAQQQQCTMIARLRRKQASAYLLEKHGIPRAPGTLAKLATVGGGPPFSHVGKIPLYDPDDLDEWAQSVLQGPVRSTSERRAAKAPAVVKPLKEPKGYVDTGFAAEAAARLAAKYNDTSWE